MGQMATEHIPLSLSFSLQFSLLPSTTQTTVLFKPPIPTRLSSHSSICSRTLLSLSWRCGRGYTQLPKALLSSLSQAQLPKPDGCVSLASSPWEMKEVSAERSLAPLLLIRILVLILLLIFDTARHRCIYIF